MMTKIDKLNFERYLRWSKKPLKLIMLLYKYAKVKSKADYYLVTSHQSGTHWIRVLIARSLRDYYNLDFNEETIKTGGFLFQKYQDKPRIYKSHLPYFFLFRNKKVIFVTRDLRDSLVSQYEKYKKIHGNDDVSFSKFLRRKIEDKKEGQDLKKRILFLNKWGDNLSKTRDILILKYEDMVSDPERELRRVLNFLNITEVADSFVHEVVDFSSLKNMKKIEEKSHSVNTVIRKGKVGDYKNYFSKKDEKYFQEEVKKYLKHDFGYSYF